jgi:ribosomal protein S18 acetylase RimI-like enzyme
MAFMQSLKLRITDYDACEPLHKERFASLNREWLERYFRVEDHDQPAFDDPEGTVLDEGGVILMVQAESDIVGTGSLFKLEEATFEIAKMAVTAGWQGRGVGEQLVLALMERAKKMGANRLFIVSNTSLERAIRLYRRHGFVDSAENRHAHYERGNITLERYL